MAPEISVGGNFSLDFNGQFYATTKIYGYIKNHKTREDYLFWLGLMNSKLFWFYIKSTGYVLRGGYYTFKTNYVAPFPVPSSIEISLSDKVSKLVFKRLELPKTDNTDITIKLEKKIDLLIYDIYNLNYEEVNFLESKI